MIDEIYRNIYYLKFKNKYDSNSKNGDQKGIDLSFIEKLIFDK